MDSTTITSANSVFTISVPGLFPVPVQLQGYSAEKAWNTDQLEIAETQMSVDGRMTAGYVFNSVKQTISLQADSPSKIIFTTIVAASRAARDAYYISGSISLPSTGEVFICTRGVLRSHKPLADAAKVLQPMDFTIEWESIQGSAA